MEITITHLTTEELEAGLDHIRLSPKDEGVVELIVRRPNVDAREVLAEAEFSTTEGLIWRLLEAPAKLEHAGWLT